MASISKQKRDKIVDQAWSEIVFARTYKQGKVKNWQKNEELYYGKKQAGIEARANVDLGRMSEFVHTLLSKVDNPVSFKFIKTKLSQLRRVDNLNALKLRDQKQGYWDMKDIVGKKQAIIYGRAIFSYFADSVDGYKAHLDNVDVYDFLIDPSAGGIDLEQAMFMGRYGVVKTRKQLQDGDYIPSEVKNLLAGTGNAKTLTQEEVNKNPRVYDQGVFKTDREMQNDDKFKFWEWYTTFEGDRYYILLEPSAKCGIRVEKLSDIFPDDLFPFWTYAAFPDLTEFWTPSYCDYVREIFMAQSVSINQMLDNAEQINKPQKLVNVSAIEDLSQLKYRRDGLILTKNVADVSKACQTLSTPSINTPIEVFNILEGIQEKASGVTAASKGVAEDGTLGIYQGNQENAADRFGLFNKSYSHGYTRFAHLWMNGVKEHLIRRTAIEVIGPDGIETKEITRRDVFYKNDNFSIVVDASDAETLSSITQQKAKINFLTSLAADPLLAPLVNQKKKFELEARTVGFTDDEIKDLLDTTTYGNSKMLSEADRDLEYLLDGKDISPNWNANLAYKQKFVDFLSDNRENMDIQDFNRITAYITALEPIILKNDTRERMLKNQAMQPVLQPQTPPLDLTGANPAGQPPVNPIM